MEDRARDLYAGLAEAYASRPPYRDLFSSLAAEEDQHGRRIRLLARHVGRAAWSPSTLAQIAGRIERASAGLVEMEREAALRARDESPSDVLRWVVEVERGFGSVHAEAMSECLDPEVARLFASLARQDEAHRALLERGPAGTPALAAQ